MTTIAYRDGIMASDSRACAGDTIVQGSVQKIFYTAGGLCGICGSADLTPFTDEFFESIKYPSDIMPTLDKFSRMDRDYGFLFVFSNDPETVWIADMTVEGDNKSKSGFYSVEPFHGIARGSGDSWAESAMAFGKSAAEAVEFASRFDSGTGGEVQEFLLE